MKTKEEISKILVESKYRLGLSKDDIAIYTVDIPKASTTIYKAMTEYIDKCIEPYSEMDRNYTELVMKHNELKQTQDKLMIEFTEWVLLKLIKSGGKFTPSISTEELLKEFKQEKGIK